MRNLQPEKVLSIASKDCSLLIGSQSQLPNRLEHFGNPADLMRIIAARQNVIDACKIDRQPDCSRIEVDRVVIELPQVMAGRLADMSAALRACFEAGVQPFRQIWNRASQMA